MKEQIKRLSLNKKTITNLTTAEMSMQVGGDKSKNCLTRGNSCKHPSCDVTGCCGTAMN